MLRQIGHTKEFFKKLRNSFAVKSIGEEDVNFYSHVASHGCWHLSAVLSSAVLCFAVQSQRFYQGLSTYPQMFVRMEAHQFACHNHVSY